MGGVEWGGQVCPGPCVLLAVCVCPLESLLVPAMSRVAGLPRISGSGDLCFPAQREPRQDLGQGDAWSVLSRAAEWLFSYTDGAQKEQSLAPFAQEGAPSSWLPFPGVSSSPGWQGPRVGQQMGSVNLLQPCCVIVDLGDSSS